VHGFVDDHVARVRAGGHPMTIADHLEADGCDDGLTMLRVSGQISRLLKPGAQYHQHRDTVYVMPQRGRPKKIKE
jgi:hypothetical protein